MSLFQCESCGCCENTALAAQGFKALASCFDWSGVEDKKGLRLCSACGPTKYREGTPTKYGKWHDVFDRVFLPKGMFVTARNGNLEHKVNKDQDFRKYALKEEA